MGGKRRLSCDVYVIHETQSKEGRGNSRDVADAHTTRQVSACLLVDWLALLAAWI